MILSLMKQVTVINNENRSKRGKSKCKWQSRETEKKMRRNKKRVVVKDQTHLRENKGEEVKV